MLILAIDTTGFSASVALVRAGKEVLFNKTGSGFEEREGWDAHVYHLPFFHQDFVLKNIKRMNWKDIDAIAASANSGIYNCIIVGTSIARTLGQIYQKPVLEVDHLLAHIYSTWLEREPKDFQFPILVFSASGSTSELALIKDVKNCEVISGAIPKQKKGGIEVFLGIGKVFDQFGRRAGIIKFKDEGVSKLIQAASKGNPNKFNFIKYYQRPLLDLNFAGFLNSVIDFYEEEKKKQKGSSQFLNDLAASFQESITEILANKILKLAKLKKAKEIHIAGGLSMNAHLEKKLRNNPSVIIRYPVKKEYRLDNAAMIGALAYYQKKYKIKFKGFKPNITK